MESQEESVSESKFGHRVIPSRFGDLVLIWREEESGPKVIRLDLPSKGVRMEERRQSSRSEASTALPTMILASHMRIQPML